LTQVEEVEGRCVRDGLDTLRDWRCTLREGECIKDNLEFSLDQLKGRLPLPQTGKTL
jgi:hypothetical protein